MKRRSELGLVFAGAHFAHLTLILWLASLPTTTFGIPVIAFGGVGMVALATLTVTSFPTVRRAVGPQRWALLHRVGIHYIAFIFAYDWVTLFPKNPAVYGPLAGLLAAAYGLRALRLARTTR
jgi:DMSO/TMAO reductase YedYZ heme-binding membrane subunit